MAYDIRLIKLVTGELVIGKYDSSSNSLKEVGILQTVPAEQGMQLMMLPYGYPFESDFSGCIEEKHFLFNYSSVPEDIQEKYLESISNISLHSGGLDPNPAQNGSGLIL